MVEPYGYPEKLTCGIDLMLCDSGPLTGLL
jgi:hypothetical protein